MLQPVTRVARRSYASLAAPLQSLNVLHENPQLRILDARIDPGSAWSVRHEFPTVRWPVIGAESETPPPTFHPAGSEVTISNSGEHTRREMIFEVLKEPRYDAAQLIKLEAAANWPIAPGQAMMLENRYVRMWDFRGSLGMDRLAFHQHIMDNAWVVLGDDTALDVYAPDGDGGATFVKRADFHDGFVSWNQVNNGGVDADGAPLDVHSVENAGVGEFREYLIELK